MEQKQSQTKLKIWFLNNHTVCKCVFDWNACIISTHASKEITHPIPKQWTIGNLLFCWKLRWSAKSKKFILLTMEITEWKRYISSIHILISYNKLTYIFISFEKKRSWWYSFFFLLLLSFQLFGVFVCILFFFFFFVFILSFPSFNSQSQYMVF